MARIEHKYCEVCAGMRMYINGRCPDCSERERREALAAWQAKTLEEKMLDLHRRLLKVESGPMRF